MAFNFKKGGGGGKKKPALSIALSVQVGEKKYEKGPSFGLWTNDKGGPAYRGTLKDEYLAQVLEFLASAQEAGLPVSLAVFSNDNQASSPAPKNVFGAGKFGKTNPFKKQAAQTQEEPEFK